MGEIPDHVVRYQRTPVFDEESVSEAWLCPHCTKRGVWARITVLEGRLRYVFDETREERILDPDNPGIVEPRVRHFIRPMGKVKFYIEFYR